MYVNIILTLTKIIKVNIMKVFCQEKSNNIFILLFIFMYL